MMSQKSQPVKPRLESVDFDMPECEQYVSYVTNVSNEGLGRWKGGFRWFYLCAVGLGAGATAVFIQTTLVYAMEAKFEIQAMLFEDGYSLWVRYLVWLSISLALASIAGALVCYVEPLAAGSGIPEIKCYLNGINQPNVLRFKTLIAKALGIVCSVAAGLPCGKEGPMIHSGAIVGAQAAKASAGPLAGPYRLSYEARDLTAAGAAAGVAAAFGAPIGGVLFAVEEGATHMNPIILVRMFVCASFGALVVRFFTGPREHEVPWGILGAGVPVEFGRFSQTQTYYIWELFIFAAIGVAGGLLGAGANALNTRLTIWRMRWIGPRGKFRFLEVLLVTAAIVSFNFFAPLIQGGSTDIKSFTTAQRLFMDVGGRGIYDLLHHQSAVQPGMLLFFAVAHYAQLIWTYGLGVPSGLFVPSLLGGACFGRLIGQALHGYPFIAAAPGIYALVGATAMLSGMARITISLSVILMETTGEAEWGLPIFITTLAAKWTADFFNKGIYDIHIELKHVPLLEPKSEKAMICFEACDFMTRNVVVLDSVITVEELVGVLGSCDHNGFPVVNPQTKHFMGMTDRSTLHHLLRLGKEAGAFASDSASTAPGRVQYQDMLRNQHPAVFPSLEEVQAHLMVEDSQKVIDLRPYTNLGCFTVPEHCSATRCYRLFRTMGLRHLPVLGKVHEVRGMITRQNLLHAQEGHVVRRGTQEMLPKTDSQPSLDLEAQLSSQTQQELRAET